MTYKAPTLFIIAHALFYINMRKSLVVIAIILLLVAGIGLGFWYFKKEAPSSISEKKQGVTKIETELVTWEDAAGFSFKYPKDLIVDPHTEDVENYAHVELTHTEHPGGIVIWVKDLPLSKKGSAVVSNAEWIESVEEFSEASVVDTTLGGEPAKKVLVSGENPNVTIGAVYDDVLWLIETNPKDAEYWNGVLDQVLSSFEYALISGEGSGDSTTEMIEVVDEEEVLE